MKKENTKALREGAMMVALTALLMLLTRYMPLFSLIGTFVCGVPMAALAARNGFRVLVPAMISVLLVSIFIDGNIISAISMILMSIAPGAAAGYMLGRKKPFFMVLFATCLVVCLGWIFELIVIETVLGSSIEQLFGETIEKFESIMAGMLENMGNTSNGETNITPEEFSATVLKTAETIIRTYFPAFVVISSMATGYIILRISAFVINRARLASVERLPFSMLQAPRNMSTVAIIFYIIYMFMDSRARLWPVFANIVFILYTIIGICGLSVVDYKFKSKVKPSLVRFLIYGAVFIFGGIFMSIISSVLVIIGILDTGRDFRKIGQHSEEL